jgi:hypothetical protein
MRHAGGVKSVDAARSSVGFDGLFGDVEVLEDLCIFVQLARIAVSWP